MKRPSKFPSPSKTFGIQSSKGNPESRTHRCLILICSVSGLKLMCHLFKTKEPSFINHVCSRINCISSSFGNMNATHPRDNKLVHGDKQKIGVQWTLTHSTSSSWDFLVPSILPTTPLWERSSILSRLTPESMVYMAASSNALKDFCLFFKWVATPVILGLVTVFSAFSKLLWGKALSSVAVDKFGLQTPFEITEKVAPTCEEMGALYSMASG